MFELLHLNLWYLRKLNTISKMCVSWLVEEIRVWVNASFLNYQLQLPIGIKASEKYRQLIRVLITLISPFTSRASTVQYRMWYEFDRRLKEAEVINGSWTEDRAGGVYAGRLFIPAPLFLARALTAVIRRYNTHTSLLQCSLYRTDPDT